MCRATREIATAYLGLVRLGVDPSLPADTRWHDVDALPRDGVRPRGDRASRAASGCAPSSRTRTPAFALAPADLHPAELRDVYVAALGYEVSATNLRRVLERREVIEPTGDRRSPGRAGGRPAEVYRFRATALEITDPFAALRPPD